jgi:dihydropteroate synthase
MTDFILKDITADIQQELERVGFDKSYLYKACDKFRYKNIKIFNLSLPQANILKQTAISVGADCALHREIITAKVVKTDCILGGSFSQLKKISEKLKKQPFKLKKLAESIEKNISFTLPSITIKSKVFDFSRPYLIGVLNLTKDSFSDGGDFFEFNKAIEHLCKLIDDGADIIELGAESTKPFSSSVSSKLQLEKLLPVLKFIKENNIQTPVSIDTRSSIVAEACIKAGADIINDISGFEYDENMAKIIASFDVPVVIQHSKGTPENMQINPSYANLMDDIFIKLKNITDYALNKGIKAENIIIDAGIGFGKNKEDNLEIIKRIDELFALNYPIMLGISRKSFLSLNSESNEMKDIFTLALNSTLIDKGVNFLRVHNVKLHKYLLQLKCI